MILKAIEIAGKTYFRPTGVDCFDYTSRCHGNQPAFGRVTLKT